MQPLFLWQYCCVVCFIRTCFGTLVLFDQYAAIPTVIMMLFTIPSHSLNSMVTYKGATSYSFAGLVLLMKKFIFLLLIATPLLLLSMIGGNDNTNAYYNFYQLKIDSFQQTQQNLIGYIQALPAISENETTNIKQRIWNARLQMKSLDFWFRYLEPVAYKKINGPLPVEWETEVFEKFEKPYKRTGAGLLLAELYLDEPNPNKDSLINSLKQSDKALATFNADSITRFLVKPDHFFFANRLFLLNLSAIYTTGFECPDTSRVIPELISMLQSVKDIYKDFNNSFPADTLSHDYLLRFAAMQTFVNTQGKTPSAFDHYHFIKDHVNPLFALNQQFIHQYHAVSRNFNDYTLNNNCYSIFDKNLYRGENEKGIFIAIDDTAALNDIKETGRLLFYDPILSGNGKRSCASCHKPTEFFNDTAFSSSMQFDEQNRLARNTPSLINAVYNHLLMLDGKHISLEDQAKEVICNPNEMGSNADEVVNNVMSCSVYKKAFQHYAKLTPNYPDVSLDHIVSAIILYYAGFSKFDAPFDRAINGTESLSKEQTDGFNLFMGKAQCATCHFVPQFNGVKPPYVSSEFEVLGVPMDTAYHGLSKDSGRYSVNPASETMNAFRTGSIRNASYTKPYMHNGVFKTMEEVINFYDNGGGAGHGLTIPNQTLSSDSLHLSVTEKKALMTFIKTLDENISFREAPSTLPATKIDKYKSRVPGGVY